MGRVLTDRTGIAFARQSAFGVYTTAVGDWHKFEPNNVPGLGGANTTVARDPISPDRQQRESTVVDREAPFEIEQDFTGTSITDTIEAFLFARAVNYDAVFSGVPAVSGGYTIPAATAAQGAKFQFTSGGPISLVYARGYAIAANNGLKPLSADLASTDVTLEVAGNSAETADPKAEVALAGIRAEAGDLALAVSAGVGTLTSGNNGATNDIDFTTLGWTVGQTIHIGGLTSATRFFGAGPVASYGPARITSIAAGTVLLDNLATTLVAADGTDTGAGGTATVCDILYGRFVRNVAVTHADFLEVYHVIEAEWNNLFTGTGNGNGYEYGLDQLANVMTINIPLTEKATATFSFVGTNYEDPVASTSRRTGASVAEDAAQTRPFNTSRNITRLRLQQQDETGLTTFFKNITLTIDNQTTGEKVVGNVGNAFINTGNLLVRIEGSVLFTSDAVIAAVNANETVAFNTIIRNDDQGFAFDIPSLTLGNGARELTRGQTVTVSLTGEAHRDATLGTSLSVSLFPVYPAS